MVNRESRGTWRRPQPRPRSIRERGSVPPDPGPEVSEREREIALPPSNQEVSEGEREKEGVQQPWPGSVREGIQQ